MARFGLRVAARQLRPRQPAHPRVMAAAVLVGALLGSGLAAYGPASAIVSAARGSDSGGYRVQPGETLWSIARENGVSVDALAQANGISNATLVRAGQRLTIPTAGGSAPVAPAASTHTVAEGENLWDIARRYGVSAESLAAANGLSNPDLVWTGTSLTIPGAGGAAAPATAPTEPAHASSAVGHAELSARMDHWAATYGIPADLLKAVTWLESGWQASIVSPDGAIGIGQLLPGTATWMEQRIGVDLDPWSPDDNIRMSAAYLQLLLDGTGGNENNALAAYYQGLGALRQVGPYGESVHYAELVQALRRRF